MIHNTKTNPKLIATYTPSGIARLITRWIAAIVLIAGLSVGLAPTSVKANAFMTQYLPGHFYVGYTVDHIPNPDGTIEEAVVAATDENGHTFDLYGNQIVFNTNGSISDSSSQVVGFVYK